MKSILKIIAIVLIVFGNVLFVNAKQYLYNNSVQSYQVANNLEMFDKNGSKMFYTEILEINYDDSLKHFIFYSNEQMGQSQIVFSVDTIFISSMIDIIDKFEEWNIKVFPKSYKTLYKLETTGISGWRKCGDEWNISSTIHITFWFIRMPSISPRSIILISLERMVSLNNSYMSYEPKSLFLDFVEVMKLKKAFSENNFNLFLNKIEKYK